MAAFSERVGEHIKCSVAGETYTSYAPKPLPPIPAIEMQKIHPLLDRANIALGHLDGLSILLPDPSLFLSIY
ncbi:MAG: Fic family protein, partial [Gammaproteobacteria bacterium]|nr:Fic family protein [Gammaproteobacteria bacterium]